MMGDLCQRHEEKIKFVSALLEDAKLKLGSRQASIKNLIWLELTGCSGNIISLLNGENPDFKYLINEMVYLIYSNSLMAPEGEAAIEKLVASLDSDYILAIEGAIATKNNGLYNIIGRLNGEYFTALEAVRLLGERAQHVIAIGTCACSGGISSARPNIAECVSVQTVLNRKVIKLPGCPCHPDWFLGTLAHIILYGEPDLDSKDRPLLFYSTTIHERCPRRSFFDNGIFA